MLLNDSLPFSCGRLSTDRLRTTVSRQEQWLFLSVLDPVDIDYQALLCSGAGHTKQQILPETFFNLNL